MGSFSYLYMYKMKLDIAGQILREARKSKGALNAESSNVDTLFKRLHF